MTNEDINNLSNNMTRDVWLYISNNIDLSIDEYWYFRGMLDIVFPDKQTLPFVCPLIQFLYNKKIKGKEI